MKKIEIKKYEDFCDDEFTKLVEGEKTGVLKLAVPVANVNEWHGDRPSPYALIAGITQTEMEQVLYYTKYVVFGDDGGFAIMSEAEMHEANIAEDADILTGMSAIEKIISAIGKEDLQNMLADAREEEQTCMAVLERLDDEEENDNVEIVETPCTEDVDETESEREVLLRRLYDARLKIDAVIYYKQYGLSRLCLKEIKLFPLQIRAILNEEGNYAPYAVHHDLEYLFVRVFSRSERIKKLTELKAPEIILRNEKRILQESVDAYIANGKRGKPVTRMNSQGKGQVLASLSDIVVKHVI